jgi:hypothetical protein
MVPPALNVFVAFPSTVLFPRDSRLADAPPKATTEKPTKLFVTVELETLAVIAPGPTATTLIPWPELLNTTQFSILISVVPELTPASKPISLSEATLLRTTTADPSTATNPLELPDAEQFSIVRSADDPLAGEATNPPEKFEASLSRTEHIPPLSSNPQFALPGGPSNLT